jgi:DNA-directed RNA polymerase specialized sigma subunit
MVGERAGVYRGKVRIPDSAVDLAFQIEFVNALRSYDPSKAALGTHVYNSLSKGRAQRWIGEHQNIGRIPENRLFKIRQFQSAREEIAVREEPTDELLAKKLNWSIKEVGRMRKELRNDLVSQGFEDDPFRFVPSKDEQVLRLFKYELDGEQRLVYEHLGGFGRKKITKTKDLSKELDMPDYRVSRIKNQIASKLKRYVDAS